MTAEEQGAWGRELLFFPFGARVREDVRGAFAIVVFRCADQGYVPALGQRHARAEFRAFPFSRDRRLLRPFFGGASVDVRGADPSVGFLRFTLGADQRRVPFGAGQSDGGTQFLIRGARQGAALLIPFFFYFTVCEEPDVSRVRRPVSDLGTADEGRLAVPRQRDAPAEFDVVFFFAAEQDFLLRPVRSASA